ncbi:hypothetical protein MMC24_005373 [Lignoscripta atroalba]|nr:hypothetical protein [Lignoscripta atroalba]
MSPLVKKPSGLAKCPMVLPEYQRVLDRHTTLASTGCTKQFCQAGRVIHTDEPRVGENRALCVVEKEAEGFLLELHREGFFDTDEKFQLRLKNVCDEIRADAVEGVVREDKSYAKLGGNWVQTPRELEFGLRRAWRNSRKCIMRSHCEELKLCDLRSVTSSTGMATELIKGVCEAFNNGCIQPTVFVFPPRTVNSRGPMIWNHQVLAFAGYEAKDGSIIGDPINVQLTKAIIELGWEPPGTKGRWDLLPIVTMAEGDLPVIAELPLNLRKLVQIRHPRYGTAFARLDLKWVPFPALTRLGFDIGGVQYTAAPFLGWLMDAEIGVRDLADTFRYNVLPDIVNALSFIDEKSYHGIESFEDLPEYERLSMLSRAQVELNYAVHWSFLQAKVNMTDTLTASMKWCRFDDEFEQKNNFRLPADPYWLAPPQGSIIPLWHRGGAPCYQPKPMICKHVEDPIKAWRREKHRWLVAVKPMRTVAIFLEQEASLGQTNTNSTVSKMPNSFPTESVFSRKPLDCKHLPLKTVDERPHHPNVASISVAIYFCSAGTIARKLASKLHDRVNALVQSSSGVFLCPRIESLDALEASDLTAEKVVLLVASSTGQGDIPANGSHFPDKCRKVLLKEQSDSSKGFKFAIFGNGDSRYLTTYNGATIKIEKHMKQIGGIPIGDGLFHGDTAVESLPSSALNRWWDKLQLSICDLATNYPGKQISCTESSTSDSETLTETSGGDGTEKYRKHGLRLRSTFRDATLVATSPQGHERKEGSLLVTIDIGTASYGEMSCIQILPVNSPSKAGRALRALCVNGSSEVMLISPRTEENPTYWELFTQFADLELPFQGLKWVKRIESSHNNCLTKEILTKSSVLNVLERLHKNGILPYPRADIDLQIDMCLDMPLLQPRTFSVASSPRYLSGLKAREEEDPSNKVDIMIKVRQSGRFSDIFLNDSSKPASLKYRFVDSLAGDKLRQHHHLLAPLIIVATGAGFGPVRCLLQQRIATAKAASAAGGPSPPQRISKISLFLGLHPTDLPLTTDLLNEAAALNIIDMLSIVPSNNHKVRVYEKLCADGVAQCLRAKVCDQRGVVFVCANRAAAEGTGRVFERLMVMGGGGGGGGGGDGRNDVKGVLGERYVEEVF